MAFARNVFVNCPFDRDFYPLLRPLLFTIAAWAYIAEDSPPSAAAVEARLVGISWDVARAASD